MNKKEWVKQFQEANGRLPEPSEFLEAKEKGEFTDLVDNSPLDGEVKDQVSPEQVTQPVTPLAEGAKEEEISPQGPRPEESVTSVAPVASADQPAPAKESLLNKENLTKSVNQAITGIQNAIPDDVTAMSKGYWSWLLSAWKQPSNHVEAEKWYGYTTIGFMAFLSTLSLLILPLSNGWVGFKEFVAVLIVFMAYYMVYVLSAFLAKRFVYGDKTFSFHKTVNHYGRLWALPAVLILASFIFVFLGLHSLAGISVLVTAILVGASSNYMMFHQAANNKLDHFYRYVLATFIQVVLLFLFFLVIGDILASTLYNAFYSEFQGFFNLLNYL